MFRALITLLSTTAAVFLGTVYLVFLFINLKTYAFSTAVFQSMYETVMGVGLTPMNCFIAAPFVLAYVLILPLLIYRSR